MTGRGEYVENNWSSLYVGVCSGKGVLPDGGPVSPETCKGF